MLACLLPHVSVGDVGRLSRVSRAVRACSGEYLAWASELHCGSRMTPDEATATRCRECWQGGRPLRLGLCPSCRRHGYFRLVSAAEALCMSWGGWRLRKRVMLEAIESLPVACADGDGYYWESDVIEACARRRMSALTRSNAWLESSQS